MKQTDAHTARVSGRDMPVSTKQAIEISKFIRGRYVKESIDLLGQVAEKKIAVPFRRFNRDMGHKPGMAAGRYPEKSTKAFIKLLNSLQANAENKGLDTEFLRITTIIPNRASISWHFGRFRRRKMRRTNIEIIAEEAEESQKKSQPAKSAASVAQKESQQNQNQQEHHQRHQQKDQQKSKSSQGATIKK